MFDEAIARAAEAAPIAIDVPKVTPGLILHVDGDYLAYFAAGNDNTPLGVARLNATGFVEKYRALVGAEDVVVHMTAPQCAKGERYLIAQTKPYQSQRSGSRKPKNQPYLNDWLVRYSGNAFRTKVWTEREADDGICAYAHQAIGKGPGYAAIATKDKDLRMIPGLHIVWDTGELVRVQPGCFEVYDSDGRMYGLKWFWMQMLMGDTADNIAGLAGIGDKRAAEALIDAGSTEAAGAIVLRLYESRCLGTAHDRFVEAAALLWMRCGLKARIDDFFVHRGHGSPQFPDTPEITAAMARLLERVELARKTLDQLRGQGDPAIPDRAAA